MHSKKFTKTERRGLPGGPNEVFTYVTGVFSTEGYKNDSPDKDNPFNIIPSGNITMKDVDFPVMGIDNLGNSKMMMPGGEYEFPGDMVFEMPMGKSGIEIKPENRGKFTRWAKKRGMTVKQAYAKVLANKDKYPPSIVKMANFARNAAGWKKQEGGNIDPKTLLNTLVNPGAPLISALIQKGKENISQNMFPVGYQNSRGYPQLLDGSSAVKGVTLGKNVSKATNRLVDNRPGVIANSLTNRFELPAINKLMSAMFDLPKNKVEERNIEELYANPSNIAPLQERQDLLNILLGVDQEYNSIPIQDEYKPSKSKDADTVYYKSPATESYIINQLQKDPQEFIRQVRGYKDGVNYWAGDDQNVNTLGNFTLSIGEDDKGEYISYYDIWDLQPFKNETATTVSDAAQSLVGLNAPEVYGRVYLEDDANVGFKQELRKVPREEKKAGGSVSWKFKGKTYSGTLIPSMEDANNRYARTHNGKIKTLPKKKMGGKLRIYKDFVNGVYDNSSSIDFVQSVFDKVNRIYYNQAKEANMSTPNYVMSFLVDG